MNENIKAGADIHAGDGGYSIGTQEKYDAFVKIRNESLSKPRVKDVMWFCGRTNVGIVQVEDPYEGLKYYIASPPGEAKGNNEQEDIDFIAGWGSTFPKDAGDKLFGVN